MKKIHNNSLLHSQKYTAIIFAVQLETHKKLLTQISSKQFAAIIIIGLTSVFPCQAWVGRFLPKCGSFGAYVLWPDALPNVNPTYY